MSTLRLVYTGTIKSGRVDLSEFTKARYLAGLKAFKEGDEVEIEITKKRARHSDAQRRYYHACVVEPLGGYLGHAHREMHEVLKAMHLDQVDAVEGRNGKLMNGLVIGGSTKRLNKLEYHEFIERCRRWALTDLHFTTEDPDPDYWKWKDLEVPPDSQGVSV